MTSPYLSDAEIAEICDPLKVPAYQVRYLKGLGLVVNRKPNGKPLVARAEFERVLVGRQAEPAQNQGGPSQPNRAALLQLFKGGKNGTQTQRR